jgi:hypothetical protein
MINVMGDVNVACMLEGKEKSEARVETSQDKAAPLPA